MIIEKLTVGRLEANCYILGCSNSKKAVVIDPGGNAELISQTVKSLGLDVQYIINTHGHMDHASANGEVKEALGGEIAIHRLDAPLLEASAHRFSLYASKEEKVVPPDLLLEDGDDLEFGDCRINILHTPGHTPGGICLSIDDVLFSGDTLFSGSVGRSDFPGGSHDDLIEGIKEKILTLPDNTRVLPGHGPETSIKTEKQSNPFLV